MKTTVKKRIFGTAVAMMTLVFLNTSFAAPHGHGSPKANKHKYYYYPKQNAYFSPMERTYYVWDNHDRKWRSSSWGPAIYLSGLAIFPRVTLHMETKHPYYYNVSHCHEYREPLLVAEIPVRPIHVASSPPPKRDVSRPRVQVNIQLSPVHVEREPVYVVHDHHPGRGHAYGHYKGKGHHKGHGHHH